MRRKRTRGKTLPNVIENFFVKAVCAQCTNTLIQNYFDISTRVLIPKAIFRKIIVKKKKIVTLHALAHCTITLFFDNFFFQSVFPLVVT